MAETLVLSSYAEGRWGGAGGGAELISAVDSAVVATMPKAPADSGAMLAYARKTGGPALRALTFAERGRLLRKLAEALSARKEELYELSFATGATRMDSAFDIEGGIGVLYSYASKAKALPETHLLIEGEREAISKGNFAGQHILTPLRGAAVHINAYNFPVWGMLEKLAPTFLAGMPAIIKPATVTAWLAAAAFRMIIDSKILPEGAVQLVLGGTGNLFDNLEAEDTVAFTGSAYTATKLRTHPVVVANSVRFNAEQDSLNASILGPDAAPDAPEFDLFVKEVVREMTQKAGQKCTAIRRAMVPASLLDAAEKAIVARLAKTTIGDPRNEGVRMGALAGLSQRKDVQDNLDKLKRETVVVTGSDAPSLINADASKGAFLAPTLLRCDKPKAAKLVHEVEAFGPVSTLMPYDDVASAGELARAGKGSLVMSLFSNDQKAIAEIVLAAASSHGRMLLIDRTSGADSTGHGAALPSLVHGGPGRAGGGEELGGLIGAKHYMQRTAIQAAPATLDALAGA
ncbi:MAG TPA: phenylacetic acid degradation bifunctional protein PaaZ [Caulobacterales bacterium]|nr:phenylacetic acid degradation bifunctional protein PaaZ [Caulobacterales bacterium]